jgi:uncharacterized protein YbbC (DUF1343 family)
MAFQNAIDRLLTENFGLENKRLGLITAPAGLSSALIPTINVSSTIKSDKYR